MARASVSQIIMAMTGQQLRGHSCAGRRKMSFLLRFEGSGKTAVIYPSAFFVSVAMGQLTLGMVLYARAILAVGGTRIGILAGIWSVVYVFSCLFLRPLLNRVLPRFLIMGSTGCMGVLVLFMARVESYAVLLVLYAFFGMILSLFWPPIMGWVSTGVEGPQLGRIIGRYNMSWCSGAVISPFICGWLSGIDARYPLLFGAVLLLLVCVYVSAMSPLIPRIKSDRGTGASHDAAPGDKDCSCPLRFPAWIGLFASFFGMGMLTAIFPLVALEEWGASEMMVGLMFALRGLSNVAGFVMLGRFHGWHYKLTPMLAAQWAAVAVFALLAGAESTAVAAFLLLLFGISGAVSYAASFFYGTSGSLNRARRMAIHESVLAGGLVCGSVMGGWFYDRMASTGTFVMVAVFLAFMTMAQIIVGRKVGS